MPARIKPPALRFGDLIGIVAPASNIKADMLEEGCRELERLGFRTTLPSGNHYGLPIFFRDRGTTRRRVS